MRGIVNFTAFIFAATALSQKTKRPLVTSIPTIWCFLMIILQLLSCIHRLSGIDIISFLVVLGTIVYFMMHRQALKDSIRELILQPSLAVFILLVICAVYLNRNAFVYAWDDINYWAASVRALFERNGLEGKYYTVSAGWGDYPLGQQLIVWWFLHSCGGKWNESLIYIGYYLLLFSFVAPYFSKIPRKWYAIAGSSLIAMLLPLVHIDDGIVHRLNADLLMSAVFGYSIYSILLLFEDETTVEPSRMDVALISIQLVGVVMIKSVGILWSICAAVLYYLLRIRQIRNANQLGIPGRLGFPDFLLLVPSGVMYLFWYILCKQLSRETYLVNYLRSAEVISLEWHIMRAKAFIYAVFFKPAVQIQIGNCNFGISAGLLMMIPWLFFLYLGKHREQKKKILTLFLFVVGTSIAYLLILLYSYETMFIYEPNAWDSVPRYLLPCVILPKVVMWHLYKSCPKSAPDKWYSPLFLGMILLLSYNTIQLPHQLCDSSQNLESHLQTREAYREKFADFYDQLDGLEDRLNVSVSYYAQDVTEQDRIYLCYLSEGTAVNLCANLNPDDIREQLIYSHATHTIIYSNGEFTEADYQHFVAQGELFQFGKLYRIASVEDNSVVLQ